MMSGDSHKVGYRNPPPASRFQKGQSGNPRGRPKGQRNSLPYESVLGQIVTIREDGVERRVTAAEAFLLFIIKRGLDGDGPSARTAMEAIEQAKASGLMRREVKTFALRWGREGTVSRALELLRMAKKINRLHQTAKIMLEPWLVEMALARLGDNRLTAEQQRVVVQATRTPWKVRWPEWWRA